MPHTARRSVPHRPLAASLLAAAIAAALCTAPAARASDAHDAPAKPAAKAPAKPATAEAAKPGAAADPMDTLREKLATKLGAVQKIVCSTTVGQALLCRQIIADAVAFP